MGISNFSIVMGFCGLAFSYMAATALWGLPAVIGEGIGIVAAVIYAVLCIGYGRKILVQPEAVRQEWESPEGAPFFGVGIVGRCFRAVGVSPFSYRLGHWRRSFICLYLPLMAALAEREAGCSPFDAGLAAHPHFTADGAGGRQQFETFRVSGADFVFFEYRLGSGASGRHVFTERSSL